LVKISHHKTLRILDVECIFLVEKSMYSGFSRSIWFSCLLRCTL